jgi:dihydroxynaphthoic acid synthetase
VAPPEVLDPRLLSRGPLSRDEEQAQRGWVLADRDGDVLADQGVQATRRRPVVGGREAIQTRGPLVPQRLDRRRVAWWRDKSKSTTKESAAMAQGYEDIRYEIDGPIAVITISRPERYNAFRGKTVEELIAAFRAAWADKAVQAVILTGAGEKAFCTGGDVKQRAETGDYGPTDSGMFEIGYLHKLIRDIPKPVIAAVNGVAAGGGHVLHVLCDLSIASETARFGQAGPRVGSFDAGFGSAYLARVVGEKRAREMWYLCRLYDAATAERWGLVNAVVPADRLLDEAKAWAAEIAEKSPTAIRFLKQSFNADTDHQAGLSNLAMSALDLFTASPEGLEGAAAFAEKRKPDFARHVISH